MLPVKNFRPSWIGMNFLISDDIQKGFAYHAL